MPDAIDRIDTPNPEYTAMQSSWPLINDLMGGTPAMRDSSSTWLPREEGEESKPYNARVARSVLFNAYRNAVVDLALRPVAKPVSITNEDQLPEQLRLISESVDDEQRNMTQFVFELLRIGQMRGLVHILVDYPRETASEIDLKSQRELGIKPLFIIIDPQDLVAWQYEKAPSGAKRLTEIRIRETALVPKGQFGTALQERIRVIRTDHWEVWAKDEDGDEYELIDTGPYTLGEIGLATIYFNKTGFMTGTSPLEDMAWLNLAHFQSQSDHRNNLRFARSGIIFAKGLSPDDVKKQIVWGLSHEFKTTADNADMKIVEHSGKAIEAGENELRHLEEQMEAMGKKPLIMRRWGNKTAMTSAIEEGKSQCELQAWVRAVEAGVKRAYELGGLWIGKPLPEEFGVDVFDDFGMLAGTDIGMEHLFKTWQAGGLSLESYLELMKARGELPANFDIAQELDRIAREGPTATDLRMLAGMDEDEETDGRNQQSAPRSESRAGKKVAVASAGADR